MDGRARHIRRRDFFALLAALGAGGLAGCSMTGADNRDHSWDFDMYGEYESDPSAEFYVGFDEDAGPFAYKDENGELAGFDVDILKAICADVEWTFKPQAIDWAEKQELLDDGELDIISGGFCMDYRWDDYMLTSTYMRGFIVVAVKEGSPIASKADLAGKVVCVEDGSTAQEILTEGTEEVTALAASFAETKVVSSLRAGLEAVKSGEADAVLGDKICIEFLVKRGEVAGITILESDPLRECHYAFGCHKDGEAGAIMAAILGRELGFLKEDGVLEPIVSKYEEYGITMDEWTIMQA